MNVRSFDDLSGWPKNSDDVVWKRSRARTIIEIFDNGPSHDLERPKRCEYSVVMRSQLRRR